MSLEKRLQQKLDERRLNHLYRQRRVLETPQGVEVVVDGKAYINFCSNDYLGLANESAVNTAFKKAIDKYGTGSGAAHLVTGHSNAHHALEEELAEFVQRPHALLFSTGYMANLGVVSALTDRHDSVIEDKLNHASLIDAAQLSRARLERFAHADMGALQSMLVKQSQGHKLVASDGVFSMDGDIAPLQQMASLCQSHQAGLLIDDAHGLGVLGDNGRGTLEHLGLGISDVPILVGTLGKAFGTFGAFVAGSEELIETLIQDARSYVYTTALPPAVAEATRASLKCVVQDRWRREQLTSLIQQFKSGARQLGLKLMPSETAIQPLLIGSSEKAIQLSGQLRAKGLLISAIRPPTVPAGTARLRITFSASHNAQHVERLLEALQDCKLDELGHE
ncbi:MAG: 8-amino-7-oxononanoate synthase [Thioalkalispiraceae bacterium]|jgi:8-amino-7-oxononanoate synthase